MADGTKRSGPRTDASLTRARQRFGPPNCSDARRRNMMIAAVLIVLGMIVIAGATHHAPRTRTPIYERHSVPWAEFRRGLRRRKGFRRTSALKYLYTLEPGTWYLVPGTRYSSARYSCVRVWYFKAPPFFAASYSYGNFLSAGLESSPIYSSIITLCRT